MIKFGFLLIVALVVAASVNAQNCALELGKGVAAHKEIDNIYKAFSDSYRTLDVEKVVSLYSENAAYLPPDNDILQGREEIRPTFKSFFNYIKGEGRTMTISFRIIQRKVVNDLAYDVGIYRIRQQKDGMQVGTGQGKFVVVAIKDKKGKWHFQVDGYNGLKNPESTATEN